MEPAVTLRERVLAFTATAGYVFPDQRYLLVVVSREGEVSVGGNTSAEVAMEIMNLVAQEFEKMDKEPRVEN